MCWSAIAALLVAGGVHMQQQSSVLVEIDDTLASGLNSIVGTQIGDTVKGYLVTRDTVLTRDQRLSFPLFMCPVYHWEIV